MNRRSILRLLGLAPIAAPAALAMTGKPELPPIDCASMTAGVSSRINGILAAEEYARTHAAGYFLELMPDGTSRFVIDASAFYVASGPATA